jgi:hypothetical protein
VPAKMLAIATQTSAALEGLLPYLSVTATDNLMSSVHIRGSFQAKEQWSNGIFHNSPYFIIFIQPEGDKRYYNPADTKVTLELTSKGGKVAKLRKYTATVDKVIAKLRQWIEAQRGTDGR